MNTMQGFLNVYKPSGMTSSKVVTSIKKRFHIDKIGHMGTLDPMACGVLPIAIGKATRMFDYFLEKNKTYIARFDFSYTTDTLDATGNISGKSVSIVSQEDIEKILPKFVGEISQIPPQYSAKSINGKRAYDYARSGEYVELKPKIITISRLELLRKISDNEYEFLITCSSGTYIRSIVRDMADAMGVCGCMTYLERSESGVFLSSQAIKLDSLLDCENLNHIIIPIEEVFGHLPKIQLDSKSNKVLNGLAYKTDNADGKYLLFDSGMLVAIGSVSNNILKMTTYLKEQTND